jgi:hypothetical protein
MQVVVVVRTRVEQDAGQLSEVVEAVVHVDDRVESQPPVPDLLDQLAAGMRDGEVDIEGRPVRVGRVGRRVVVDQLGPDVALDRAVGGLRPDAVEVLLEHELVRHVQERVRRQHGHRGKDVGIARGHIPRAESS